MKVLVFDDEEAIGRTIVRAANLAGFDAVAVTHAEAFAQQLRRDPPQLVMLDLQLGATDGVQQMQTLAELNFTGVVVPMSGFDTRVLDAAGALAQDLGLNVGEVLTKPLSLDELERVLEKVRRAGERLTVQRLRAAIANDELVLDFQPVVTRNPNRLKKLEVLVRWNHPLLGRLMPAEFLPLAKSDPAAMQALSDWVVAASSEAYQVMAQIGVCTPMSVNMSILQLQDSSLPDRLEQLLRAGGMPARHLHIEITDAASLSDTSRVNAVMARLRLKHIAIAMNSFGSGYASLKLLRQLPFTEIKLDRSFVGDIETSRESRAIVKSMVDLSTDLAIECVAEGVESAAAADRLESIGVCQLQGDFIARPLPLEAIPGWLATFTGTATDQPAPPEPETDRRTLLPAADPDRENAATPAASGAIRLPPRQTQVMQLIAEGCSVKEIARRLGLGPGTVKVHLSLAYSTLGARNRIEAVRRFGALPDPPPRAAVDALTDRRLAAV